VRVKFLFENVCAVIRSGVREAVAKTTTKIQERLANNNLASQL
jgi:Arc/MetJ-type ribon-helix-helix transcriptional regulator